MGLGYVDGIVAWAGAPRRLASSDQTVFILVWFFSLYLHRTTNIHFILPSPSFLLLHHLGFITKRLSACVLPSSIKWFSEQSPSRSPTAHSRYPSLPSLPPAFTFLNPLLHITESTQKGTFHIAPNCLRCCCLSTTTTAHPPKPS